MQVISTIIFLSLTVLFMLMGPISWGAAGGYLARRLPIRALGCLIARDLESARSNARPSIWAKSALIGLGAIFLLLWFTQVRSLSTVTSSGWSGVTGGLNSDEREIAQESDDPMFSAAMARAGGGVVRRRGIVAHAGARRRRRSTAGSTEIGHRDRRTGGPRRPRRRS